MSFVPDIRLFTCHYTSQQSCARPLGQEGDELSRLGFPANIKVTRVVCTGKIQETTLLQAFEDGADGVYVVGCPADGCHNVKGSQRAAKRVMALRQALRELAVEPERIAMFHLPRGLHPEFVATAKEMDRSIRALGPSPFRSPAQKAA